MRPIHWIIASSLALVCLVAFFFAPAWAQDAGPVIAPSSWLYEVWTIVQPIVVLLVSTVGPVLVTWIAARLIALLKVTDEKQRVEIETKLRDALHQSALNAVKYALMKTGLSVNPAQISGQLVTIATEYVREKNPEAVQKLGVDAKALEEIIMSKLPELVKAVQRPPEPQ
ncbi:hypothetical protein [Agrobacterium tumefaciens]|uniref:hypothetical protein n=1 Tax=Agrobacterium tumefaciens TaxID=358 RepID=UPI0015723716|nr:hypothetical protein [Agrobacterium tumefaciens]NTD85509.1 hypothetical protein [Agrobacterium tumefaciens]NTD90858.1 hypothetical protein [Agrobacterium tumefaciens]NTE03680.1 hypothetical protein [Agrobacterium tumefaciens]NTE15932.1 hypothetical protein [Agrobacterium tumefaciens]NTE26506.1 hypothetical protein [Agrobacterium tumefaciens]